MTRLPPELCAAILAAPDDPEPYLVLGDWLQGQGEPRGELIALMHAAWLADATERPGLHAQVLQFFEKHRTLLFGRELMPLIRPGDVQWWDDPLGGAGYLFVYGGPTGGSLGHSGQFGQRWRLGYVEHAYVGRAPTGGIIPEEILNYDVPGTVRTLLAHPSFRFLRKLTVGATNTRKNEYVSVIQALVDTGCPRTLDSLTLGAVGFEFMGTVRDTELGDLTPLYAALPQLRELTLKGTRMELGTLDLPELRHLCVMHEDTEANGLPVSAVRAIARATLPRLESLDVHIGLTTPDGPARLEDLEPLFDTRGLPRLRKLKLLDVAFTDALIQRLRHSALLPQLQELSLYQGTITQAGAETLLAHADAFRHLHKLELWNNRLTPETSDRLRARLPCLRL